MILNCRLQDIQEREGALGVALEDVENETGHGGNCRFSRGLFLLTLSGQFQSISIMKKMSLTWGLMKKNLSLRMGIFIMMVYSVLETHSLTQAYVMAVDCSSIGGIEVTGCSPLSKNILIFLE